MGQFISKLKLFLQSKWLVAPLFFVALIFQTLGLYEVNVLISAIIVSFILLFCEDVKNIFAIIFYVSFFIGDIYVSANWYVYGVAIGLALISFVIFTIRKVKERKLNAHHFKFSRIFIPLCFASVAFVLGGIFSNFSLLPFLATLGFSLAVLFLVFVATNYSNNLKEYLPLLFTLGAVLISLEIFIQNVVGAGSLLSAFTLHKLWIGAQNVNAASLFILIGQVSCLQLGFKKKNGYLYLLLSAFLTFAIVTTLCRMVIALAVLSFIILAIYSLVKTDYKKSYAITFCAIGLSVSIFCLLDPSFLEKIISSILSKIYGGDFFRGRIEIWDWCFEYFSKYPVLGYGFTAPPEALFPLGPSNIILAHNTFIQWLVSLGVLGTLVLLFFSFCKYKIAFLSIKEASVFPAFLLVMIALSGLVDQAAQMDIFIHLISIITLVSIDDCSPFRTLLPLKKHNLGSKK